MIYHIDNWEVVGKIESIYSSPESATMHIKGEIYGHPNFHDGDTIETSKIIETDGNIVKTLHETYKLVYPNERYSKWYLEKHGKEMNIFSPFPQVKHELSTSELLINYVRILHKFGEKSKQIKSYMEHHGDQAEFAKLVPVVNYIDKKYRQQLAIKKAAYSRLVYDNYENVN